MILGFSIATNWKVRVLQPNKMIQIAAAGFNLQLPISGFKFPFWRPGGLVDAVTVKIVGIFSF